MQIEHDNKVVITGLGSVSGAGHTCEHFWSALQEGKTAISDLPNDYGDIKISIGALVPAIDETASFSSDEIAILDRFSLFAVLAAEQAVCDAGLSGEAILQDAAAIIGTGCGGKHTDEETYTQLYKKRRTRAHPLTIPKGMPSAAASMVSRRLGIRGSVFPLPVHARQARMRSPRAP